MRWSDRAIRTYERDSTKRRSDFLDVKLPAGPTIETLKYEVYEVFQRDPGTSSDRDQ